MENEKKHVLIALSGMSPAVLTEAVWGLATGPDPIVPDKVVVLTTAKGRALIQGQLLKGGVWKKLAAALAKRGVNVEDKLVFEEEMPVFTYKGKAVEDLPTRELNLEAANTMMRVIREYAEDDDCVIHALMAGGRKTMSALFFSSMCLLGRKCDHVYHVLVSEGYDDFRLQPPFYFPQKGVVHKMTREVLRGKKRVAEAVALKSEDCTINLFDVPFVPMGDWAEQKCKAISRRLSYENVINAVTSSINSALYPTVEVDVGLGSVSVNGLPIDLTNTDFAVLLLLLQGFGADRVKDIIYGIKDDVAAEKLRWSEWRKMARDSGCRWVNDFIWKTQDCQNSVREAYYRDDDAKNSHDYDLSKSHVKTELAKASALKLLELFTSKADGTFVGKFEYAAVGWRNLEKLPPFFREYLFPEDAPFRVAPQAHCADNPRTSESVCGERGNAILSGVCTTEKTRRGKRKTC